MLNKTRLVIIATHPIQYHAPWFRELAKKKQIDLTVLFGIIPNAEQQSVGFGKQFSWDISLRDGYYSECLDNVAENPNLSSFSGIDCPSVYSELKRISPDIVVLTGWHSKLLIQSLFATQRLRIKTIMRGESNAKKQRPWYVRLAHRILLSRCHAFLSIGKSNTQFYTDNGINANAIFNAPYFIDNSRFINDIPKKITATPLTEHQSGEFCFIYAGKLIEKKNVKELLTAFQLCYATHQNTQLLIVGDGELKQKLEKEAQSKGLPVNFLGFVNQKSLPSTYTLGDCFLLGSDYDETWGLVVNEAMVCGLPAIVSNRAGSSDDLIIDGKTGFVYQFGDPEELSRKMIYMIENQEKARLMGTRAREHVTENYNVHVTVDATIDAINYLNN